MAENMQMYPNINDQPANVIVQQPLTTTTTVVTTQQGLRPWSSELCSCFNDIKSCLCSFFFGNCYYACIATRMGENCCVGCSGYASGCVPGGHLAMRSRFRGTHGIQGDICGDCCLSTFCLPCSMCQISREMDSLNYPQGTC